MTTANVRQRLRYYDLVVARLRAYWAQWSTPTDPAEIREKILLVHEKFQPGYTWASLPRRELIKLDARGRYIGADAGMKLKGGLAGGLLGWVLLGLILYQFGVNPVVCIMAGGFVGGGLGWWPGIKLALAFLQPPPLWLFRLGFTDNKGKSQAVLTPIVPRSLLQEHMVTRTYKNRDGELVTEKLPMVFRGDQISMIIKQPHKRRLARAQKPKWEGMQMMSGPIGLCIALAIIIFFFVVVTAEPPPLQGVSNAN